MGTHDNAIKAVEYSSDVNGILTGSWDATVKMWDPRAGRCIGNYTQPDKVNTANYVVSDTTLSIIGFMEQIIFFVFCL